MFFHQKQLPNPKYYIKIIEFSFDDLIFIMTI